MVGQSLFVRAARMNTATLQRNVDWACGSVRHPTRVMQRENFVVFQLAWFAAVLGSAHGLAVWGCACVLAAIGWHVATAARPVAEARLVAAVLLVGLVLESAMAWQGFIGFASGQLFPRTAPYWMVALWGLLAITLNVTLRWLKGRWWLAAAIGAVAGPLSFVSGARLGAAHFIAATPALATLACVWAAALPALMWLSSRFDGVIVSDMQSA